MSIATTTAEPVVGVGRPTVGSDSSTWLDFAICRGRSTLFIDPPSERPDARRARIAACKELCRQCPVMLLCRDEARRSGASGIWGGETDEERRRPAISAVDVRQRVALAAQGSYASTYESNAS